MIDIQKPALCYSNRDPNLFMIRSSMRRKLVFRNEDQYLEQTCTEIYDRPVTGKFLFEIYFKYNLVPTAIRLIWLCLNSSLHH